MKKFLLLTAFTLIISCGFDKKNDLEKIANNDAWVGEGFSGFEDYKVVSAQKYMVSSADKRASAAGAAMLAKGGNAVDAAIAAQMVLNVVEPQSSGIGGGMFFLYYDAKTKKSVYFNGREKAPAAANENIFLGKDGKARDFYDVVGGGLSVGTPGALKALKRAHEEHGKLPWKDLFEPAIKIAQDGFSLDERIYVILKQLPYLSKFDGMKIYFEKDGTPKKVGAKIKNPELAKTFETIAAQGIAPFYEGKIAQDMVAAVQNSKKNPGFLSLADLKNYNIKKGDLICGSYRKKYKICSMPLPSSGGVTILQTLKILENFDLEKLKPSSKEAVHLISEATRLAYADRNEYVADVPNVPIKEMLDEKYLKERASLIKMDRAMNDVKPGKFKKTFALNSNNEKPSTTHVSIVDADGNAVSMTSSIEYLFGSVLMVDGFMLNNQLTDFSLSPTDKNGKKVANRLQPRKQPRSSMSPAFIFDEKDNLVMVIGSPGGPRIIQYVVKAIIASLDWHLDMQEAISLPNHVILNDQIELENRTTLTALKTDLEKMGHKVKTADITSGLNGVAITPTSLQGGSDPRRSGAALGN